MARFRRRLTLASASSIPLVLAVACSSSSGGGGAGNPPSSVLYTAADGATSVLESPGHCATSGGPVAGPQDDHCSLPDGGRIVQPTTAAGCTADAGPSSGDDGGGDDAAVDAGNCGDPGYGPTMDNSSGADDDCKYDVAWTSTPICTGQPVYFTVLVTHRTDGTPLTGANTRPDIVQDCAHPIPNSPAPRDPSPEVAPGTYVVGPIAFDRSGVWVVRFHFDELCLDLSPESPHGHAAFYVSVP